MPRWWMVALFGLVVSAWSSAAFAQAPEPGLPTALEGAFLEEHQVERVPRSARVRRVDGERVGVSRDGLTLYVWGSDGHPWEVRLAGAHLPTGTRLLPIRELDTVRFASLGSEGVAVVLPGAPFAWVFDSMTEGATALPLERADSDVARERALRATVWLRAMRTCPTSRAMCALYGSPGAVRRAQDPAEPPGGFFLREQPVESAPAGLAYTTERHDSPYEGVSLRVDKARTAAGELVEHVSLVVGEREVDAFAAVHARGLIDVDAPALVARGAYLYVYSGTRVSIHDRATGRRIRQYGAVLYEPYYDVCLAGDDGIWVVPVFRGTEAGFALFFERSRTAIYYEDLGVAPRRVPLEASDDVLYGVAPVHGQLNGRRLRLVASR